MNITTTHVGQSGTGTTLYHEDLGVSMASLFRAQVDLSSSIYRYVYIYIYMYIYTHYLKLPIATNFVTENVARVYNFQAKTLNLHIPKTNQQMQ